MMKVFVKTRPNAKKEKVEQADGGRFIVSVKEPPKEGKANEAVIRVLAEYLGIAKSRFKIISGRSSKQKVINIS